MFRRALFFFTCSVFTLNAQSQSAKKVPGGPPDSVLKKVLPPGAVAAGQTLELKTNGETYLFYFSSEGRTSFFTASILSDSAGTWVNHPVDTIRRTSACSYRPGIDTAWWANLDNDPANELCVVVCHSWLCDTGIPYYTASFYDDPAHRFALLPLTGELAINIPFIHGIGIVARKKIIATMRENGLPRK